MSLYTCSKCGEGGLNQYGHGRYDGSFSCDDKPEPKKEKPMTRFRKKPVVIEAFRFRIDPIPDWFMDMITMNAIITYENVCHIKTLEGVMRGEAGDYIIKGVKGEIYPCKPDVFAMTYEPVGSTVEKFGEWEMTRLVFHSEADAIRVMEQLRREGCMNRRYRIRKVIYLLPLEYDESEEI